MRGSFNLKATVFKGTTIYLFGIYLPFMVFWRSRNCVRGGNLNRRKVASYCSFLTYLIGAFALLQLLLLAETTTIIPFFAISGITMNTRVVGRRPRMFKNNSFSTRGCCCSVLISKLQFKFPLCTRIFLHIWWSKVVNCVENTYECSVIRSKLLYIVSTIS